ASDVQFIDGGQRGDFEREGIPVRQFEQGGGGGGGGRSASARAGSGGASSRAPEIEDDEIPF
ncbi:MAG TPA: hypothetical protein VF754_08365, partial [Pyrinomonadaceae bacterium]